MKKIIFLLLISLLLVSVGCARQSNNNILSFKYGVIYTSNLHNQSKIVLLSQNWNIVKEFNLNVGGLQKAHIYKEKLYIPVTGIPSNPGNEILEFNMKTGSKRYIKTKELPIKLAIVDNFLYVIHNTSMDSGILTKINLEDNKIIKEKRLDGVLRGIASAKDEIFVFADNPFRKEQSIYELDKDLNEMKIRINKQTAFHTDSLYFNGKFLIINNAKNDYSGPTNKIFLLENQNASMNIINLTENAPYQIFRNNDNIVVAHYDFPTRSGKKVTVWDNELNFKKGYELKNNLYLSHMNDNIFYSLDVDYDLYQYDSNDFTLLSINRLKKINGMVISDFFVFDQ